MEAVRQEEGSYIDEELYRLVVEVVGAELRLGVTIDDIEEFVLAIYNELAEKRFGHFALTA